MEYIIGVIYGDNGKENGNYHFIIGYMCTWGSYYNIPKAIFYLLKGDYTPETWKHNWQSCLLFPLKGADYQRTLGVKVTLPAPKKTIDVTP